MNYQVLARRWRPRQFAAVVGQDPIVRTLQNALARGRVAHAYLFAGPRGVGKTTMARLLAMGLGCEAGGGEAPLPCGTCASCLEVVQGRALDVIEIDGASNRGIDEVRALRENARYAPARRPRKVYIIDEVHMLTEPAFNALLKTLEEPPAHVVFVLATTEPWRLPATILSRCQRFDFRPIPAGAIRGALERVLTEEAGLARQVEPEALALLAAAADGSLRDALSLLDAALAYGQGMVTAALVRELLGRTGQDTARALALALVRRDAVEALARIEEAAAEGHDVGLLCQDTMEVLRRALLRALAPGAAGAPDAEMPEVPVDGGTDDLLMLVKGLLDTEAEMRRSPHPRVELEVAVVRLCRRPVPQTIETVLERLERAEARLRGYGGGEPAGVVQGSLLEEPAGPGTTPAGSPARLPSGGSGPAAGPGRAERGAIPPGGPAATGGSGASQSPAPGGTGSSADVAGEALWREVVAELTRVRPTLGRMLAEAAVVADEGDRLVVTLPNGNAFVRDQVRQRANQQLLLQAARRWRPGLREVAVSTPPGGAPPAATDPQVQVVLEIFDGELTAVRRADGEAGQRGEGP